MTFHRHIRTLICLIALALTACARSNSVPVPTVASQLLGLQATPFATVVAGAERTDIITAGYYFDMGEGATLVGGLSFSGEQPAPLDAQPANIVWLDGTVSEEIQGGLQTSGAVRYAPLLATGQLEGPGTYGPDGRYSFQLTNPRLSLLVPVALTVTALLNKSPLYEGQFVRVKGALIANTDGALLADQVEAGGVPTSASRQIKLVEPVRDAQLLARLHGSTGGIARYGEVEVEGFWQNGVLRPLGIVPLEAK